MTTNPDVELARKYGREATCPIPGCDKTWPHIHPRPCEHMSWLLFRGKVNCTHCTAVWTRENGWQKEGRPSLP